MKEKTVFSSPKIYYEIEQNFDSYSINVYLEGFSESVNPNNHCRIENFTEDFQKAEKFAKAISSACALPLHIPELAEEFLSI